jgi:hypothetical protein
MLFPACSGRFLARIFGSLIIYSALASCGGGSNSPGEGPGVTTGGNTNQSPGASITTPGSYENFTTVESIGFTGSGSDAEDGLLSGAALAWFSNIDGQIGNGDAVSVRLTAGQHVITLTATDTDGATSTATVIINVLYSLEQLAWLETNILPKQVTLAGDRAYVADRYFGLHIIDISSAATPNIMATLSMPGGVNNVSVSGQYIYSVGNKPGAVSMLQVIDVTNPNNVATIGELEFLQPANDVVTIGDRAYVVTGTYNGSGGFSIVDITNPTSPIELGNLALGSQGVDIEVADTLAYVVERRKGLRILDITDPATPQLLGQYDISGVTTDVEVKGSLAYLTLDNKSIQIVDVSNPAAPSRIGLINLLDSPIDVELEGDQLYIANNSTGLQVFNVANPASPTELGSFDAGFISSMAVAGGIIFAANSWNGFQVLDVSVPTEITTIGGIASPAPMLKLDVSPMRAYVCDAVMGLRVIDITNATSLTELGSYQFASPVPRTQSMSPRNILASNNTVYVVFPSTIRIMSVANPGSLQDIGGIAAAFAEDIDIAGNIAYVADKDSLKIHNIANPAAALEMGSLLAPGYVKTIKVVGNRVYLGYGASTIPGFESSGLLIIDVSDPAAPVELGRLDLGTSFYDSIVDLEIVGNELFALKVTNELLAIDISDPSNPVEIDKLVDFGIGGSLTINDTNDKLYIAGNRVFEVDISDPTDMVLIPTEVIRGEDWQGTAQGSYLYLADRRYGLRVFAQ